MKYLFAGAAIGFLAGGVLGGATFGPVGSLVGSIAGIPLGATILWAIKGPGSADHPPPAPTQVD